jgi:hypothetical protein
MRPWLLVVALLCACGSSGPPPGEAEACAAQVAAREHEIAALLAPTVRRDGHDYLDMTVAAGRAAALRQRLGSCAAHPALQRLARFSAALAAEADPARSFGLQITDRAYLADHRDALALPPLLRDPSFLAHLREPAGYADALAMIEAENATAPPAERWTTLLYQSRFLATPDETTHGRLLVLVPGPPDLWIQFGIATPEMDPLTRIHSVSVVAAGAGPRADQALLLDYWRTYDGDRVELTTRLEAGQGGSNCYGCHKLPVLPIRPAQVYELDASGALRAGADRAEILAALDRRIAGYGALTLAGGVDPDAWGPTLGPPGRPRDDTFMRRCTASRGLDAAARARVRAAMRCGACHDGGYPGTINVPQALRATHDLTALRHPATGASMPLVREYVTQGWMPPGARLGAAEREALYDCLMLDYWDPATGTGVLADWLRGH